MREIKAENRREKAWLAWGRQARGPHRHEGPDLLRELSALVRAAGVDVVGSTSVKLHTENSATVLGSGTVDRMKTEAAEAGADVVIFQNLLKPRQQQNLAEALELKVLDRREVILDLFAQRARTREGKLQVELAQLSFRMGRLAGGRKELGRLGGGIGTRGPGEKKLEEDRRKIRTHLKQLKEELDEVRRTRTLHYQRRKEVGYPVVAIVGYTNAGKSTLFNRLTGAAVFVADQLFATLDPTARSFRLPSGKEAIIVDTVGFIHELPKELREAFLATLEGIGEADLLIHVVDGADPGVVSNIRSVRAILDALGYAEKPSLLVFNKSDKPTPDETMTADLHPDAYISATKGTGVDSLLADVERILGGGPQL